MSSSSARDGSRMKIAVCWKWVSLDREHEFDERWAGVSAADEAALEVALAVRDSVGGETEIVVLGLGPADADDVLRSAAAAGATTARRIDASTELDSSTVARALAGQLSDVDLVLCGDYSIDRGTGSVPAFIAAELGIAQALGLVEVETAAPDAPAMRVVRRLDGGRREVLDVALRAELAARDVDQRTSLAFKRFEATDANVLAAAPPTNARRRAAERYLVETLEAAVRQKRVLAAHCLVQFRTDYLGL